MKTLEQYLREEFNKENKYDTFSDAAIRAFKIWLEQKRQEVCDRRNRPHNPTDLDDILKIVWFNELLEELK